MLSATQFGVQIFECNGVFVAYYSMEVYLGKMIIAMCVIGIDTKIEVIVASPTTWLRPRAVVSFTGRWWRNNDRNGGINFYSIMMKQNQLQINKRMQGKCSKLPQNCLSYSMVTCAQLAIVQWSHVTWLFLPGNTCSNHCDVKTRFVTLNFSHTLHENNWQNTHYNSW